MQKINDPSYLVNNELYLKNRELNKPVGKKKTDIVNNKKKKSIFDEILNNEIEKTEEKREANLEEIQMMLKDVGLQGEVLKKSRNIEDLDKYKKLVKKFIMSIIDVAENTEKKSVYNRIKKEKITKVHLNIIDKELLELTKIFISEQYEVLKVASKIDKIEGMLISILS
ncbi:MAG TPA: DUF327 family protein [Spirochaetota bacterium]|nr:DUF327 family protein [Spirochaetota bacterium]